MTNPAAIDSYLTPAEVAELLHVSESQLTQMRYRGTGPKFSKVGRRPIYKASNIAQYVDSTERSISSRTA